MSLRKSSSPKASKGPKRIKKSSSGTTIAVHLPADLRSRVDAMAERCGLSKQDFYRICLGIGTIFCKDYGLFLPEEITALRAAEETASAG